MTHRYHLFLLLRFFRFSAALSRFPAATAFLYALEPLGDIRLPLARFFRMLFHSPGFLGFGIALLTFAFATFAFTTVHRFVLFGLPASHVLHDQ
jgi:hypothetical protein